MKKILLSLAILFLTITVNSQPYKSIQVNNLSSNNKKPLIYYSIPKTEIVFEIKANKIIRTKGIYSQSAYLLGLKNIITSDELRYSIKDIIISSRPIANPNNQYAMMINPGVMIKKSDFNTLEEIIVDRSKFSIIEGETKEVSNFVAEKPNQEISIPIKESINKSLLRDRKLEKISLSPQEVVDKIQYLKEKQIDILSGGLDGTYINTTVDFMYKQLDEIIESYISLFTGVESIIEETHYYKLLPEKPIIPEEDLMIVICRFSELGGFSSSDIKNDFPALMARFHTFNSSKYINIYENLNNTSEENKTSSNSVGVYYSIPEKVLVSVEVNDKSFEKTLDIIQYGVISNLSLKKSNIRFNPNYGSIKSIY